MLVAILSGQRDHQEMTLLSGWPTSENGLALLVTLKTKQEPFGADRNAAAFLRQDGYNWSTGQRDESVWKVF